MTMAASDRFEVPPEMRALAEKSVEQARQAFDGFISAAHQAVSAFEGHAETARKGARDVTEKAMTCAERNITSAFEFAQELVRAKDMQDVLRLQADYIQRQMQALTEQAKELGKSTSKAAKDTAPRWAACPRLAFHRKKPDPESTYCATQYFCSIAPKATLYPFCQTAVAFAVLRTAATKPLSP